MKTKRILSAVVSAALLFTSLFSTAGAGTMTATAADVTTETLESSQLLDDLMDTATSFIAVRHYQLGGSHYAYTEYLNEVNGGNADNTNGPELGYYKAGSQLVLVELEADRGGDVKKTETILIDSVEGMIRDPDVSADGERVLFSWKQSETDDFHLYEANIEELRDDATAYRQLTFGSGDSQTEPKYLPNGNIIFSCSKITQTIDCWYVPVSNLYICGPNGENMVRVGYDQVHTTYPTVTEDGRVLYTRWDYNDRNQMYIQGVFQMMPDGTNQTEVYGNDPSGFVTSFLHTRAIPGTTDKYMTIGSGHHTRQLGKLMIIDTSKGRNSIDAVDYVFQNDPGNDPKTTINKDGFGQSGYVYKYPYPLNENEFLVAFATGRQGTNDLDTPFSIYLMNTSNERIELVKPAVQERPNGQTVTIPASQIVPVMTRDMFVRPSTVDYSSTTGTYYMANVYEGEGMEGVEFGEAKQLRVVALEYRSYAIGATTGSGTGTSDPYSPIATGNGSWDVKRVLGVVPIEEDGSALFKVPANTPIYFQVLDEKGEVIQTMRSWSTLMPNETFSCVGCHEDKNTVPPAASKNTTIAMNKGVQEIQPESWQDPDLDPYDPYGSDNAFSYLEEVQPILDESCVQCHSNTQEAFDQIGLGSSAGNTIDTPTTIVSQRDEWTYTFDQPAGTSWRRADFDDSAWETSYAPFGMDTVAPGSPNTIWDTDSIWMRKTVQLNQAHLQDMDLYFQIANAGAITIYVNGSRVYSSRDGVSDYTEVEIDERMKAQMEIGQNTIAIEADAGSAGQFVDVALLAKNAENTIEIFNTGETWDYFTASSENAVASDWNQINFNDRTWKSGRTPIGDREGAVTSWTGDNVYLWARKEFTLTSSQLEELKGATLIANTWYDDDPVFYINGHEVFSDPGKWVDNYADKTLSADAADYLVEGTNVFAVRLHQHEGGRQMDLGLTARTRTVNEQILFDVSQSDWQYTIRNTGTAMDEDWMEESYRPSGWTTGKIDGVSYDPGLQIWARKTFTIDDSIDLNNKKLHLNIKYDENPVIYINGNLVFSAEGFNDKYHTEALYDCTKYLKRGENTIAVSCFNTGGGSCIDIGMFIRDIQTPISFENVDIVGQRQEKFWPLSYLVLTGSTANNDNWKALTTNRFTNYVSSMSQNGILEPRQYGSCKSNIMTMLRENHQGVNLTDEQLRTIAAWIDLEVPCYGSYDENVDWNGNQIREADEKVNKRNFNDMVNEQHMKARAGLLEGEINVTYTGSGRTLTSKADGFVEMYVDQKYQNGDTITVELPEGEQYLMFSLSSRIGESLIYVPDGTFTYTLSNIQTVFPKTVNPSMGVSYTTNTITARVATEEDLQTRHNLARNSYDLKNATGAYPHVTTSTDCRNQADFEGRNAIDGFHNNKGHGGYSAQSWGPELQRDDPFEQQYFQVDFGREVYADEVRINIRADFPHDTYYTSATLEFSDGSTEEIQMRKTADAQVFTFEPRETSYVKIKDLRVVDQNGDDWAGITEFEVYGTENEPTEEPGEVEWTLDEQNATVSGMPMGTTVAEFIAGFGGADVTVTSASGGTVSASAPVGTGMLATYNGVTYTVAVQGDLNGDGTISIQDIMSACRVLARNALQISPTPVEMLAADLTENGRVAIDDVMSLCRLLARKA